MNTFISYCFNDESFVMRISYYLRDQSAAVPKCYALEKTHKSWADQVDDKLMECESFVLVVGETLGEIQKEEAMRARRRNLRLVRVTLPGAPEELPVDLAAFSALDPIRVTEIEKDHHISEFSAQRCAKEISQRLLGPGGWRPQFGIPDGYPFSYEKRIIQEFVDGSGRLSAARLEQGCPETWPQVEHADRGYKNPVSETIIGEFSAKENHVFVDARLRHPLSDPGAASTANAPRPAFSLSFAEARPRKCLRFPDPRELANRAAQLTVGIIVSGGIAPGINSVIAGIVERHVLYQEHSKPPHHRPYRLRILGFRDGFKSLLTDDAPPFCELNSGEKLTEVREKASRGGSMLGTSRLDDLIHSSNPKERADRFEKMAVCLREQGVQILYVVGGDGSMRAAHALRIAAQQIKYPLAVAAIPKTMDNDILWVWQSFGFLSAVEKAKEFIMQVHTEASSNPRVCVMQLFGSDSGFVVSHAALASGVVTLALIPEIEFSMTEICAYLRRRLEELFEQGHSPFGVVVMSETAIPTDYFLYLNDPDVRLEDDERTEIERFVVRQKRRVHGQTPDALRTGGLKIVSRIIQRELARSPDDHWSNLRVFTNEPRHLLRSLEPSAADIIFGERLGCLAVDNAMAGYNDFMVSQWMTEFVLVPLELVVLGRKRVPPTGIFWRSVLASTRQPANLNRLECAAERLMRGDIGSAESFLGELFAEGVAQCSVYCHLAQLALHSSNFEAAHQHIAQAWVTRSDASQVMYARILWYQLLSFLLSVVPPTATGSDKPSTPDLLGSAECQLILGRLKWAVQSESPFAKWRMDATLKTLKPLLSDDGYSLLRNLIDVLNHPEKRTDLESVPAWQNAEAIPRE